MAQEDLPNCSCGVPAVLIVDLGAFRGCVYYCREHVPESMRQYLIRPNIPVTDVDELEAEP